MYAATHQLGWRAKPYEIRLHNKKALAWASGHSVRKVNHPGSEIPTRPFLALEDRDEREVMETVEAYLRSSLGRWHIKPVS
ncbi:phage virion morphogenesis protein [Chromobacterium piscinae]|uniref:phage virion morphogenesis protein n=1 Tax=Chromobacterium piscinae TaxID=686831 RepID=UPI003D16275B